MKNGIKMLDIANKLGVSVVTVSNALAGRDGVSESMRKKICETAESMGYVPSNTKCSRKKNVLPKISQNVGILTSERFVGARGTFYWELTALISSGLSDMSVLTVYECIKEENERDLILPTMISENRVGGVIVIGQIQREYIEKLSHIPIPIIFVDFYDAKYYIDSVNSDSYNGGYVLTDYLIGMGHRDIGFCGTLNATSSINDRFFGYRKCLAENNIRFNEKWLLPDRDDRALLFDTITFPDVMPTAFVCNSDETAFRLMSSLKSKGVRVPEDISIVGYDNYTVSSICIPAITTISVNLEEMASCSVDMIIKKMSDPDYKGGRKIIGGKLIIKESVLDIREKKR